MKPSKLYIENFMCHDKSYIDFSKFNSALIVGKKENSDLYSNAVGKTSIFKAIEYVLFNQADINLEKIIRDDTNICVVVFDFFIGDQEYRVSRKRTKKGITDLTLLQRSSIDGSDLEIYHTINNEIYEPSYNNKFWKDISGRRALDTEKELDKLIKINFKSFRSIVHFMQHDFSGLTTSTPEKRKNLFKDVLNLMIYSKLEKLAKGQANIIYKDLEKNKILINSLGNVKSDLQSLQKQFVKLEKKIIKNDDDLKIPTENLNTSNVKLNDLISFHKDLENKYVFLLEKEKLIILEKSKIESSLEDYRTKKLLSIKQAKKILDEIKSYKDLSLNLNEIDYKDINILSDKISDIKQKLAYLNVSMQNNIISYSELKIPVPDDNYCKHCRQPMSEEHKKICKNKITQDMEKCQNNIALAKKEIIILNNDINNLEIKLNILNNSKRQLDDLNIKLLSKDQELKDKKNLHAEYSSLVEKFIEDLNIKNNELLIIKNELEASSLLEANLIKNKIDIQNKDISSINILISSLHKERAHLNSAKAVLQHNIEQKNKELSKLELLENDLLMLEKKYAMYPSVIQAFSSIGIPNLIIQNVLDDLQLKSNELLIQLKPELQLSFFIEKTKADGSEADTLDIIYYVNGREREYEQLSGAMKLAVSFSLKLGLSFLLQNMLGTNIQFLLLDEIDQSLDKASVDAFADIVKFFQKDFTILVITHNDRLKDKFAHAILVEQDINSISRAKVVDTW